MHSVDTKDEAENPIKLLMVGESGVGKSCLLTRFADDSFSPSFVATIGIDFRIRVIEVGGVRIKLQIWDTAGQERFRTITSAFYRGAMGVVLAYDSTDPKSFETLPSWMEMIRTRAMPNVCLMLVATKCDKSAEYFVSAEQGGAFATEHGMMFMETSAKDNINVNACFIKLTSQVLGRFFLSASPSEEEGSATKTSNLVDLKKGGASSKSAKCCK